LTAKRRNCVPNTAPGRVPWDAVSRTCALRAPACRVLPAPPPGRQPGRPAEDRPSFAFPYSGNVTADEGTKIITGTHAMNSWRRRGNVRAKAGAAARFSSWGSEVPTTSPIPPTAGKAAAPNVNKLMRRRRKGRSDILKPAPGPLTGVAAGGGGWRLIAESFRQGKISWNHRSTNGAAAGAVDGDVCVPHVFRTSFSQLACPL